jgi:hypothetical protein
MTRHKGDESPAPENWSGAVNNKLRLANLDCQYPVNDEYAERHQSRSLARAASKVVPGFSSE